MQLGAIDIGSNAIRLFFANVFDQKDDIVVEKASLVRVPVRLGEDVFVKGKISKEKVERLVKTMTAFKLLIEVVNPVAYKAVATSAMREASNAPEVIKRIKQETGIAIEVIDGLEEARIVGMISNLNFNGSFNKLIYVDVGGGSTEITILENHKIIDSNSFKIGTVRLLNGQVKESEWVKMKEYLLQLKKKNGDLLLVGSGGNINKITKIYGDLKNKTLSFVALESAMKHLSEYSVEDRVELMGLRPDRADVIVPAGQIYHFVMHYLQSSFIFVPRIGLSDGIVSMLYRKLNS